MFIHLCIYVYIYMAYIYDIDTCIKRAPEVARCLALWGADIEAPDKSNPSSIFQVSFKGLHGTNL